jgi:hypothetical protein
MNADRNFRMRQSTKRMLATLDSADYRNGIKRAMIQAQLIAERARSRPMVKREASNE